MNSKKVLGPLLGIFIVFLLITVSATLINKTKITEYDVQVAVDKNGNATIKEVLTFDFKNNEKSFKKSIIKKDSITISALDNEVIVDDVITNVENNEINIQMNEKTFNKVILEYTINDMVTMYNDTTVLSNAIYENTPYEISNMRIRINIPNSSVSKELIHTYLHLPKDVFTIKDTNYMFELYAKNIKPGSNIDFKLLIPNEVFDTVTNIKGENVLESITTEETNLQKEYETSNIIYIILLVVIVLLIISLIVVIILTLVKYDVVCKVNDEYFDKVPSFYPPAVVSYLFNYEKNNFEDITSTLTDLLNKGVIDIEKVNDDYKIIKTNKQEELLSFESLVLYLFIDEIGNGKKVNLSEIEMYCNNYDNTIKFDRYKREFDKCVQKDAQSYNLFVNANKRINIIGISYILVSLALCVISTILKSDVLIYLFVLMPLSIIYMIYVKNIRLRTEKANVEYLKWKGFKRYLVDKKLSKEKTFDELLTYTIYANTLDVDDKLINEINEIIKYQDVSSKYFEKYKVLNKSMSILYNYYKNNINRRKR